MSSKSKNVKLIVLGDIGRSPRMQYHSLSLADMGHKVDIIGYGETVPTDKFKTSPSIYYHFLLACPQISIKLLNYIFKTVWQSLNLLFLLSITRKPHYVLVQNPPAIPSLVVCWIYSRIVGAKFIIDWHNYAFTIMALNLSPNHKLVTLTEKIEWTIGRRADYNFCVSKAMKEDLRRRNIRATTLYDRSPEIFHPITIQIKNEFLQKMSKSYNEFVNCDKLGNTAFTVIKNGVVDMKAERPAILVSSTSWTEDEDFSVLLSALRDYEKHCVDGNMKVLPDLRCVITGKGNLKQYYCELIAAEKWQHVKVITPWLEAEDYPLMLASADLGVSLHTSSSSLDLPMKVIDMFGCGLPVLAYDFKSLNELVIDGKNGYKFSNSKELSNLLQQWFESFPNNPTQNVKIEAFKMELQKFQKLRWNENWTLVASHIFK